ncbi:murein biosynthesis integral membrane protein MurJ [Methyloglobulus sp.]|uniref:murein biosynthesis integral membrane protein MurJ n=1 Tax=Methyloglobulus sp. TaxID=2518622 RepID=UPI00398A48A8
MGKRLYKATVVVSSMTLISRLLGFVRDMLIARLFGADLATDAFFVAFKIPNFLRRLFTEGAFAHAIVPVMANRQGDKAALREFIGKTAGTLAVWVILITLLSMVLAPLLVLVLAPGFAWQGQQYELAVTLLRITLPFGLCIVLVAYAGAVLNAHEHYAIPALTPIFLNICMIAAALWLAPLMDVPITALAWGVFAAGVVQLLFQVPSLIRLGLLPKLSVQFKDPDVSRVIKLLLPAIFSASVTQVNLLLDTLIASFLVSGSVSWLYYSDRLVEFPLGILGMGLATVILPSLANNHAADDTAAFSATLDWGLRLVLLVGMPATIGLFILAEPMLSTLFQYNEFTVNDVHKAGQSLKAYSVGLLGYLFIKILIPGFTSRQDLNTPVRYGIYAMIISLALNVALVFPLAHAGLALATSLGAFFNAMLLLNKLLQEKAYQPRNGWLLFLGRVTLASAAMAAGLCYFVDDGWWNQWESADRIINLVKWISIGCIVYALALTLSGLRIRHFTGTSDKIGNF